jgi:hypothetical protein
MKKRKKKVVHTREIKAKVHVGTRNAQIIVTIPINKLARALVKRGHVNPKQ